MKPMLKSSVTKRFKLQYDETPSNFAFKFNLRSYRLARMDKSHKVFDSRESARRNFSPDQYR